MPGIIVAIVMKRVKNSMKVHLYEKSYHKCNFLKESFKKIEFKHRDNSKRYFYS